MRRPGRPPKLRQVARAQSGAIAVLEDDIRKVVYNERITRARVDTLEAFFAMPWYERLWWFVSGRCKYFTVSAVVDAVAETDQRAAAAAPPAEASV